MKIIILILMLILSGCGLPSAAYVGAFNDGYVNYQQNMRALMYQQALDRQNLLMSQQNMILQQNGWGK